LTSMLSPEVTAPEISVKISMRMLSLSLIWGVMVSLMPTDSLEMLILEKPPVDTVCPVGTGIFWPTSIDASSLSVVRMVGVESTLTLEVVARRRTIMPAEGITTWPSVPGTSTAWPRAPMVTPLGRARLPPPARMELKRPIEVTSENPDPAKTSPSSARGEAPCMETPPSLFSE